MVDPVVPINQGWQPFSWAAGPDAPDLEGPFTFTTLTPVILTVTDAYCIGDQFRVLDNGVPIGWTPAVPVPSECTGTKYDPDDAVQDPAYSHTSFNLPAGMHSITLEAINNPFGGGGAFLRVDAYTWTWFFFSS